MNILITGASGYIGSHTLALLLEAGHEVTALDNLSNSSCDVIKTLEVISNKKINFIQGDILDTSLLNSIFKKNKIDCVIHFAALKSVEDSISDPITYYKNNITGSINLLNSMHLNQVKNIIFSSSATVYGKPSELPIDESHQINPTNPYGKTKAYIEEMLKDISISDSSWKIICLRYFNPVGSHPSGLIGESPKGIPSNLMPYISMVANGLVEHLNIYGDDYDTRDGTGVRDYIHVMDLAEGHLAAVNNILLKGDSFSTYNLGTGSGFSVKEIVEAYESASNKKILCKIKGRRHGDIASCYAKVEKAKNELNWVATKSLQDMCQSAWNFSNNYDK